MSAFIAVVVVAGFLAVFVGFPLFAAWDLQRQGYKVAPKLLVFFAVFVVVACIVDLTVITALGTKATTSFETVVPPRIAPPPDKAGEGLPGDK